MSDATASDPILYDVDGHVATITTNRPERYNSLNYEAYRLLTEYSVSYTHLTLPTTPYV